MSATGGEKPAPASGAGRQTDHVRNMLRSLRLVRPATPLTSPPVVRL
eukprot:COSAG06_NODE_63064_length_263_cov_0.634146_1_plen_46_part_10